MRGLQSEVTDMAIVHYTARAKDSRTLELPEAALLA
jgi:hypothetical protein